MAARTSRLPLGHRPSYRCTECGWTTGKWLGRCPECHAWGTIEELGAPAVRTTAPGRVTTAALPIGQVDGRQATARSTGVPELDRVLGGGLVPGAVVLLAGEPGVGKSTLLLDVAAKASSTAARALYVTGEELAGQVRLRADRIGALSDHLYLAAETDLSAVLGHLDAVRPSLLVLDSVQAVASPEIDGAPGGMAQVREVTGALLRAARERGMSTILVGHVTKDGAIAGPRLLEHLVDVVLHVEGDRHARLRLVRGVKNRFGATDEVGCFELHDEGITGLADPSGLFLTRRDEPVPGTCLTVTLEGRRPLVAEVQALTVDSQLPYPRRTTSGLETSRVAMMLAVLEQRGKISQLGRRDVYTATVGGVKLTEPAADLAVVLALASAACDTPLPKNLIAIGEVGLAGEVRRVTGVQRRLAEAARLGFPHALVPVDPGKIPAGMRVTEVADVGDALRPLPRRLRREVPAGEEPATTRRLDPARRPPASGGRPPRARSSAWRTRARRTSKAERRGGAVPTAEAAQGPDSGPPGPRAGRRSG
jgi:DNA repair protein RadA/Sms